MKLLYVLPGRNTREIQREVGGYYQNVRRLLDDMQRQGLIQTHLVRRYFPGKRWILVNEWKITRRGEEWMRRENLLSS